MDAIVGRKTKSRSAKTTGRLFVNKGWSASQSLFLRGLESGRLPLVCMEFGLQLSLCFAPVLLIPAWQASSLTPDVLGPLGDLLVSRRRSRRCR